MTNEEAVRQIEASVEAVMARYFGPQPDREGPDQASLHERAMTASLLAGVGEQAANLFLNAAHGPWNLVSKACAERIFALIGKPADEQD